MIINCQGICWIGAEPVRPLVKFWLLFFDDDDDGGFHLAGSLVCSSTFIFINIKCFVVDFYTL